MPDRATVEAKDIQRFLMATSEQDLAYVILRDLKEPKHPYPVTFEWDGHKLKSIKMTLRESV
jgi:hypothetical protein